MHTPRGSLAVFLFFFACQQPRSNAPEPEPAAAPPAVALADAAPPPPAPAAPPPIDARADAPEPVDVAPDVAAPAVDAAHADAGEEVAPPAQANKVCTKDQVECFWSGNPVPSCFALPRLCLLSVADAPGDFDRTAPFCDVARGGQTATSFWILSQPSCIDGYFVQGRVAPFCKGHPGKKVEVRELSYDLRGGYWRDFVAIAADACQGLNM